MKYISLDTNAILDLCYRTYPEETFPTLWTELDSLVLTNAIRLHISSSVLEETIDKVRSFDFDEIILSNFLARYFVKIIDKDDFGTEIISIRQLLLGYPFAASSPHATSEEPDVDLIALANFLGSNGIVVTGEIGFIGNNWNTFMGKRNTRIKIPDICCLTNTTSCSWSKLFSTCNIII